MLPLSMRLFFFPSSLLAPHTTALRAPRTLPWGAWARTFDGRLRAHARRGGGGRAGARRAPAGARPLPRPVPPPGHNRHRQHHRYSPNTNSRLPALLRGGGVGGAGWRRGARARARRAATSGRPPFVGGRLCNVRRRRPRKEGDGGVRLGGRRGRGRSPSPSLFFFTPTAAVVAHASRTRSPTPHTSRRRRRAPDAPQPCVTPPAPPFFWTPPPPPPPVTRHQSWG